MLIRVNDDEFIPADLVVLHSADPKGGLFVETKNLDGETNLKAKAVAKQINDEYGSNMKSLENFKGTLICEKPNNAIYKFEGYFKANNTNIPLSADNMLLRGCKLRNTPYVIGLVVFTGPESKIMQNSSKPRYKFSTLE